MELYLALVLMLPDKTVGSEARAAQPVGEGSGDDGDCLNLNGGSSGSPVIKCVYTSAWDCMYVATDTQARG